MTPAISSIATAIPVSERPSRKFGIRVLIVLGLIASMAAFLALTGVDPLQLFTDFDQVKRLVLDMWPPNLGVLAQSRKLWNSVAETLAMAFLGTAVGGAVAMILAFFAARNISPHPALRFVVRALLALERSTPSFVIITFFLIAAGIGPFAGVLSLAVSTVGMFGRLFSDAIEHVDSGAMESVAATGAARQQVIRYAVLPEVTPAFTAILFYAFDVNLRAAIAFGVFGAGGIGFELSLASHVLRYRDMLAYTVLIVMLIAGMERISDRLRRAIIGTGI